MAGDNTTTNNKKMAFEKLTITRQQKRQELPFTKVSRAYSLNEFIEKTGFTGYEPKKELLNIFCEQAKIAKKEVDNDLIKLMVYINSLNKRHNYFYSGLILYAGFDNDIEGDTLQVEDKKGQVLKVNAVWVEYRKDKDFGGSKPTPQQKGC